MLSIRCALLIASASVRGSSSSTFSLMADFNPLIYLSNFSASLMSLICRHNCWNSLLYLTTECVWLLNKLVTCYLLSIDRFEHGYQSVIEHLPCYLTPV